MHLRGTIFNSSIFVALLPLTVGEIHCSTTLNRQIGPVVIPLCSAIPRASFSLSTAPLRRYWIGIPNCSAWLQQLVRIEEVKPSAHFLKSLNNICWPDRKVRIPDSLASQRSVPRNLILSKPFIVPMIFSLYNSISFIVASFQ